MTRRRTPARDEFGEVASGCACQAARRAARAMTGAYDEALRPSGLRATQFSLMVAAALAGSPTVTQIAEALGVHRTTLTRDLARLEQRALIEVRVGEDRRSRVVEVTEAGWSAMADALPRWREVQARVLDQLGESAWSRLSGDLPRLAAATGEGG